MLSAAVSGQPGHTDPRKALQRAVNDATTLLSNLEEALRSSIEAQDLASELAVARHILSTNPPPPP